MGSSSGCTRRCTAVTLGMVVTLVVEVAAGPIKRTMQTAPIEGRNPMINVKVLTWSLGLFAALSFVVCVLYGLIAPESLHMHSALETILPGFRWLTISGFGVGLVESFLYGVYGGLVFGSIYNALWKRWGM